MVNNTVAISTLGILTVQTLKVFAVLHNGLLTQALDLGWMNRLPSVLTMSSDKTEVVAIQPYHATENGTYDLNSLSDANPAHYNTVNFSDGYDYEYDYNVSIEVPLMEVVPLGMVYGLTLVLGVTGNTLVIFAIAKERRMQTVTNAFLVSLASADLLLVLLCVPIKVG